MRGILLFAFLCAGLLQAGAIGLAKANEPAVDVALVLAVDISASVDARNIACR